MVIFVMKGTGFLVCTWWKRVDNTNTYNHLHSNCFYKEPFLHLSILQLQYNYTYIFKKPLIEICYINFHWVLSKALIVMHFFLYILNLLEFISSSIYNIHKYIWMQTLTFKYHLFGNSKITMYYIHTYIHTYMNSTYISILIHLFVSENGWETFLKTSCGLFPFGTHRRHCGIFCLCLCILQFSCR